MFKKAYVKIIGSLVLISAYTPVHLQAGWIRQRRVR